MTLSENYIDYQKRYVILARKAIKYAIENDLNKRLPEFGGKFEIQFIPEDIE